MLLFVVIPPSVNNPFFSALEAMIFNQFTKPVTKNINETTVLLFLLNSVWLFNYYFFFYNFALKKKTILICHIMKLFEKGQFII